MAWSGGVFTRNNGVNAGSDVWTQDKGDGTKILASLHDAHDEDMADGIQNCLTKDGQNSPSADLPMGGYKHTGVGSASDKAHYVSGSQIITNAITFGGTSSGGANAFNITLPFKPDSLVTGAVYSFIAHQNSASTSTVTINSDGALQKELKDYYGSTGVGSIKTGDRVEFYYDGSTFVRIPCNGPRLQTFSPTLTAQDGMTISTISTDRAIIGKDEEGISINAGFRFTVVSSPSARLTFTVPVATSSIPTALACAVWGGTGYHSCVATVASSTLEIRKLDGNFTAGVLRAVYVNGKYPTA